MSPASRIEHALGTPKQATPTGLIVRAVSLILCFALVAESLARIDDWWQYGTPLLASPDHDADLILFDSLGVRGRPNGQYRHWKLNSFGFRGPARMSKTPPPGVTRVLVLGSSETIGLHESPDHEYAAQLRDSLASLPVEIVNAGIPGLAVPGLIQLWRNWAVQFRPDVVVVYANSKFYLADDPPRAPRPNTLPLRVSLNANGERSPSLRIVQRLRDNIGRGEWWNRRRFAEIARAKLRAHPATWPFQALPTDRLGQYLADVDTLLSQIQHDGATVILVVPATGLTARALANDAFAFVSERAVSPRATAAITAQFIAVAADSLRYLGARRAVRTVDAAAQINDRAGMLADGVHFTDKGAAVLAGLLAPAIRDVVEANRSRSARFDRGKP
jgi:lysophospholipase L1-like esterase